MMNFLAPLLAWFVKPNWTIYRDSPYGSDPQQVGDFYMLNGGVRPAVIFIHGGGWSAGDKSVYEGRARRYALAGFHVIAINYRLAKFEDKSTQWPAQLNDVRLALKWVRDRAGALRVDPGRICVAGDSAGGHLSLMLGLTDKPVCILNMFGPCDLRPMSDLLCKLPVFGGGPATEDACPIERIGPDFPPTLTIHGTRDSTVAYEQALTLDRKLEALGVDHSLISYDGGHEFTDLPWWKEAWLEARGLWWIMRRIK